MEPGDYAILAAYVIPLVGVIFWSGKKLGTIETKVKNIEGDIIGIKKDIKFIRNGK